MWRERYNYRKQHVALLIEFLQVLGSISHRFAMKNCLSIRGLSMNFARITSVSFEIRTISSLWRGFNSEKSVHIVTEPFRQS